jgi:hypothetical protein
MTAAPSNNPLLNEYRKRTEAPDADPRAWQAMERRLFAAAGHRVRRTRFLIGSLATALAMATLAGLAPRLTAPSTAISPSGAGGSEGSSGRGWGRGGTPGSGGV